MGAVTLAFVAIWFLGGGEVRPRPRSTWKAMLAGLSSGVTTMVAHSGGPPLAIYLLPLGMSKALYAGTTSLFFTVGNLLKAGPWLVLATPSRSLVDTDGAVRTGCPCGRLGGMAAARAASTSARSTAPVTPFWSSPRQNCCGTGWRDTSGPEETGP